MSQSFALVPAPLRPSPTSNRAEQQRRRQTRVRVYLLAAWRAFCVTTDKKTPLSLGEIHVRSHSSSSRHHFFSKLVLPSSFSTMAASPPRVTRSQTATSGNAAAALAYAQEQDELEYSDSGAKQVVRALGRGYRVHTAQALAPMPVKAKKTRKPAAEEKKAVVVPPVAHTLVKYVPALNNTLVPSLVLNAGAPESASSGYMILSAPCRPTSCVVSTLYMFFTVRV
jgi:hypothetical protein